MYSEHSLTDRPPVASGRFYPDNDNQLKKEINSLLAKAEQQLGKDKPENENLIGLIAPHAGYVFSGKVAAAAFLQLRNLKPRKKVFLIGSSHNTVFEGASVYNQGDYVTPLGKVSVNIEVANKLTNTGKCFRFEETAHADEHCIEVLLPFLQFLWKEEFEIIPIIIATQDKNVCKEIASLLVPWFTTENLFVISTDLSHYPNYKDAVEVDSRTTEAVLSGNPDTLWQQIEINENKLVPHLSTSMCGWTSVLTLMHITTKIQGIKFKALLYENSGDSLLYGDHERVVGYQSFALYSNIEEEIFILQKEDKKSLLEIARNSIKEYLKSSKRLIPKPSEYPEKLNTPTGAFVSVYKDENLLGCIGNFQSQEKPLASVVAEIAVSAAFYDNRFPDVRPDDVNKINIEISVLTPLKKINSPEEIELGKHGIYIKKGEQSGTFLPQVAPRTSWSVEEFLGNCSKNKAGLGWNGWKDADLYTYEAIVFSEKDLS